MNFYPFHLGDYASHTGHLEPLEDLAYRRMLDLYYLREAPLSADISEVCRLIRMRNSTAEVQAVLNEFFVLSDDGWRHLRCDQEIERMQDKQAKARASAAASVNARKRNAEQSQNESTTNVERTLSERSTDAELPIPIPIPIPNKENPILSSGDDAGSAKGRISTEVVSSIADAYNAELADVLPKAQLLNDARKRAITARVKDMIGTADPYGNIRFDSPDDAPAWFAKLFKKVRLNPHWVGENDRGWRADLDWLMNPKNFVKVLEYVPVKNNER